MEDLESIKILETAIFHCKRQKEISLTRNKMLNEHFLHFTRVVTIAKF